MNSNLDKENFMKINPLKFVVAGAITAAIVWIICSLLVWMMPGAMMNMTTNLFHIEMGKSGFVLSPIGVLWGLIGWSLFAGIFAWILATVYNLLTRD